MTVYIYTGNNIIPLHHLDIYRSIFEKNNQINVNSLCNITFRPFRYPPLSVKPV